jgi:hypothetical protein
MRKVIAVVAVLVAAAATPAAQAVWNAEDLRGGGAELRLGDNEEGAAIILVCDRFGVSAGFEFPSSLDPGESASIRGFPGGERQNVTVAPVNDGVVRLTSGRGIEALLRLLRDTPILYVRAGGAGASFAGFGSAPVVTECLERQDEALRAPGRTGEVQRVRTYEQLMEARERSYERQAMEAREREARRQAPAREPAPE